MLDATSGLARASQASRASEPAYQSPSDRFEVVGYRPGAETKPRYSCLPPFLKQISQFRRRGIANDGVAGELGAGEFVQRGLSLHGRPRLVVKEDDYVCEDVQDFPCSPGGLLFGLDRLHDGPGLVDVLWCHVTDIGRSPDQLVAGPIMGKRTHKGLALRRAGRDRWPFHVEPAAPEIYVVQPGPSMNRPEAASRISAPSSQLSQRRRTTSM
jgi:hypothetical protein